MRHLLGIQFVESRSGQLVRNSGKMLFPCDLIFDLGGGRTVTATVVDRCAGCAGAADLDFSEAAFAQLADPSVGRIHGVQWDFV
jgi:hypothetical protein